MKTQIEQEREGYARAQRGTLKSIDQAARKSKIASIEVVELSEHMCAAVLVEVSRHDIDQERPAGIPVHVVTRETWNRIGPRALCGPPEKPLSRWQHLKKAIAITR